MHTFLLRTLYVERSSSNMLCACNPTVVSSSNAVTIRRLLTEVMCVTQRADNQMYKGLLRVCMLC